MKPNLKPLKPIEAPWAAPAWLFVQYSKRDVNMIEVLEAKRIISALTQTAKL
jgi:hypothetical protein